MAYTLDIALVLGSGKAGITDLRAQLFNSSGVSVGSVVSTGFIEIGSGNYLWHYAGFPDGHRGGAKFFSNADPSEILAIVSINPEEAENLDEKVTDVGMSDPLESLVPNGYASGTAGYILGHLNSQSVTVVSPVTSTGEVELIIGDDYFASEGRSVDWIGDTDDQWPDLTGADVYFNIDSGNVIVVCSVITPTGTQHIRAEPTTLETLMLEEGNFSYDVTAVLSNNHDVTIIRGTVVVKATERV